MLSVISEASATEILSLVSIDPGTILFTLINTFIIFLIFRIFLFKPVCGILDKRKEMAAAEISEAQKAKDEAERAKKEYAERLQNAKSEAAEIVKQATLRAQKREDEIISEANEKAADIRAKAQESIERDRKRALNEVKDEISDMVILAATKVVGKEITADDNEAIISEFLNNVGNAQAD